MRRKSAFRHGINYPDLTGPAPITSRSQKSLRIAAFIGGAILLLPFGETIGDALRSSYLPWRILGAYAVLWILAALAFYWMIASSRRWHEAHPEESRALAHAHARQDAREGRRT